MIGRNWCFTLNNYTAAQYESILKWDCKYVIAGKEIALTGTPHVQGYVQFNANKRLSALKKILPTAHWEIAKGTPDQASDYCKKEGAYKEAGERRLTSKEQGLKQKELWADVIRAAKDGTAETEYPMQWVQYNSTLSRMLKPVHVDLESYNAIWYYGPPGTGKSRTARLEYPGAYDKLLNKWWDGYNNEPNVLIDDLSRANTLMGTFLKRYADHYPFRAEYKGGSMVIRPKTIIVTSNYTIEELWADDPPLVAALLRRFKVTRFPKGLFPLF